MPSASGTSAVPHGRGDALGVPDRLSGHVGGACTALGSEPALEEMLRSRGRLRARHWWLSRPPPSAHLDLSIAAGAFPVHTSAAALRPGGHRAAASSSRSSLAVGARVFVRGAGVGMELSGCWATRVAVPSAAVHPLPRRSTPYGRHLLRPCWTAYVALFVVGRLEAGERVAVRGAAGAVGSAAAQLARAGGAREVLAVVRGGGAALPIEAALADGEPARSPRSARTVASTSWSTPSAGKGSEHWST